MSNPDSMETFKQFLAAKHLAEVLLMKHAQEASEGKKILYGDIQIEEALEGLAERLGFRVFRVLPEVSPVRGAIVQAAE